MTYFLKPSLKRIFVVLAVLLIGCFGMHNSEQARYDGYVILLGATARQSSLA